MSDSVLEKSFSCEQVGEGPRGLPGTRALGQGPGVPWVPKVPGPFFGPGPCPLGSQGPGSLMGPGVQHMKTRRYHGAELESFAKAVVKNNYKHVYTAFNPKALRL